MQFSKKKHMGEKRKVVMLLSMSFLPHQGRYLRVYNEAGTLVRAGMDVTIIAWDRDCKEPREEVVDGIRIERIWKRAGFQRGPSNILRFLTFYSRLLPRLLRKEVDVIHCFNLDTVLPGLLVAKARGKKVVLDLCEPDYYANWPGKYRPLVGIIRLFERISSNMFDYLLVHNHYQIKKFLKHRAKAHIGSYPNRPLIVDRVEKEGKGTVVIGRFGSIYRNNGIEEMIDVFKKLKPLVPGIRLLLAGKIFEEFQEEFDRLVSPLGDTVEVRGDFVPKDLPGLYRKIDISLQLSRRTDWFKNITPTKFFESLANGVVVVTSDIGGLGEIIEEYNCGVIVDETNPESVFFGLRMLVDNPDLRFKMAKNGLRAINEKYNWDLMGQRLLGVYKTLDSLAVQASDSLQPEVNRC